MPLDKVYSKVPPQQPDDFVQLNNRPRVFKSTNSETCAYITVQYLLPVLSLLMSYTAREISFNPRMPEFLLTLA